MIVRDAILCDEPYTLRAEPQACPMVHEATRPVPTQWPRPVAAAQASLESTADVQIAPAQAELTVALVNEWLAGQDRQTLAAAIPGLTAELEAMREAAHAAGFSAGQLDGRAALQEQAARQEASLQSLIDGLRSHYQEEQERLAVLCVDIVATAIGKIAGPLLATREAALGAVTLALAAAKPGHALTVRVHPADVAFLEGQREQLALRVGASWALVADPQVALGGCIIESQPGTLDARFEVQLQELFETLRIARQQLPA